MKKKTKITLTIILCIVAVIVAGMWILSVNIYDSNIDKHYESYEPLMFYVDDFEGLERTRYEFPSDKGQMLTGYMYSSGDEQHGIIVIAHGYGGGGHNSYMDCADYFARNGYYVFAYDATGNDESEGESVGGFPQGLADLDSAISFVENSGNFPALPIGLFGHSWGGYCVCSVLKFHPEVKAVIECSGANRSSDYFEAGGKSEAGSFIYLMMPFVRLHERITFGKYGAASAMKGFAASDAAVMIVHSEDDDVVPIEYGYDVYYDKYASDPRFKFIRLTDKGHNAYEDPTYRDEINAEFPEWVKTLDYDYKAEENLERFAADKADYLHRNLDRSRYSHMLNADLFETFVEFYNENM